MTDDTLANRLRALANDATLGPWIEDDGHIHSEPRCRETDAYIKRLMSDEDFARKQGGNQRDRPWTVVAHCSQEAPNFQADADYIAAINPAFITALADWIDMADGGHDIGVMWDAECVLRDLLPKANPTE